MSALNGDKARFNRIRKQKIARRKRKHEILNPAAVQPKAPNTPAATAPRTVPA